jgi:predicted negative regulator of RcsB-dependent stress response
MSNFDLQEQEQLSELKLFWQQYGKWIGAAVAGLLIVLVGWQVWSGHTRSQQEEANALYGKLIDAATKGKQDEVKKYAGDIQSAFPGTEQAALAALMGASAALQQKDDATAKSLLNSVLEFGDDPGLSDIATLRLAGILLDEKAFDAAAKLLERESTPEFSARFADLKGDVLAASGKPDQAREAWQKAQQIIEANQKTDGGDPASGALNELITAKLASARARP